VLQILGNDLAQRGQDAVLAYALARQQDDPAAACLEP
jgi:hypothetical protein